MNMHCGYLVTSKRCEPIGSGRNHVSVPLPALSRLQNEYLSNQSQGDSPGDGLRYPRGTPWGIFQGIPQGVLWGGSSWGSSGESPGVSSGGSPEISGGGPGVFPRVSPRTTPQPTLEKPTVLNIPMVGSGRIWWGLVGVKRLRWVALQ